MRPPLVLLITSIIIFFGLILFYSYKTTPTISVNIGSQAFQLEIASSVPRKTRGLSHRTSLCPTCGMIFVFNTETIQQFWMKDTFIPLDLIFLDHQGRVINIVTAQPELGVTDTELKLHRSTTPSQYVIEINANTSSKVNLKPGDIIKLPPF